MKWIDKELNFTVLTISSNIVCVIDTQSDHLDVTNEDEVHTVIMKYTTQSDVNKNVNTLFNCAGYVRE